MLSTMSASGRGQQLVGFVRELVQFADEAASSSKEQSFIRSLSTASVKTDDSVTSASTLSAASVSSIGSAASLGSDGKAQLEEYTVKKETMEMLATHVKSPLASELSFWRDNPTDDGKRGKEYPGRTVTRHILKDLVERYLESNVAMKMQDRVRVAQIVAIS